MRTTLTSVSFLYVLAALLDVWYRTWSYCCCVMDVHHTYINVKMLCLVHTINTINTAVRSSCANWGGGGWFALLAENVLLIV